MRIKGGLKRSIQELSVGGASKPFKMNRVIRVLRSFEKLFETHQKEILHSRLLMVDRCLKREGQVMHIIVSKCFDFTRMLGKLVQREVDDLPVLTLAWADENRYLILIGISICYI